MTIKLLLVVVALVLFATPTWAQPQEENQDVPPPIGCWDYWSCGGRYPTCQEWEAAGFYCSGCERCKTTMSGQPYCGFNPLTDDCDTWIINFLEVDPEGGDPAFLRKLVGAIAAPACTTS
jgi:hypothetical protein